MSYFISSPLLLGIAWQTPETADNAAELVWGDNWDDDDVDEEFVKNFEFSYHSHHIIYLLFIYNLYIYFSIFFVSLPKVAQLRAELQKSSSESTLFLSSSTVHSFLFCLDPSA